VIPSADAELSAALDPVRAALLRSAHTDADGVEADAARAGEGLLRKATVEAEHLRDQAKADAAADVAASLAASQARAGREARARVLAALREEYDTLREAAYAAVAGLERDPTVHRRLVDAARARLGPEASLEDAPGGGVTATLGARRLDLSLAGFADRAVDAVTDRLEVR
jgi:hypothetical protein